MSNDPYTYPGTNVLRNKADIHDGGELARFEYINSGRRLLELQEQPTLGQFDLKHLQKIHKHLFQDVYDWAGQLRTVMISKGTSAFAFPEFISSHGEVVFCDLKKDDYLRNMTPERFIHRMAYHYAEINALHPFRDGNGRSTREFLRQLVEQAGYLVDYSKVNAKTWNNASRESFSGRLDKIEQVFRAILAPERSSGN